MCVCAKLLQSCLTLCDPMDYIACQAPLSKGFSKQEYWSGLPFSSPAGLLYTGIEPASPAFQADSLLSEPSGAGAKSVPCGNSLSFANKKLQ